MVFEVVGFHMGRYGRILCESGSYIKYLAIGIKFDPTAGQQQLKLV